jgi:hypothetical protein
MGRTIPSFTIALEMEKEEWKPFRNALDKSDRKKFDEMFDIPRLYTSACSYAANPVRLYPILMSILLYHHKQLTQCISEVERIEARLNSRNNDESTKEKEGDLELLPPLAQSSPSSPAAAAAPPTPSLQRQLKLSEF